MDFKAIPFSHLSFDASLSPVTKDDFAAIINQDFFYIDESDEAVSVMTVEDMAAIAEFDARHAI